MLSLVNVRHADDITTYLASSDICAIDCFIDDWFLAGIHYTAQQRVCVMLRMDCPMINSEESVYVVVFFLSNQELLNLKLII